ncbi:hypothetical protein B9Z55_025220 [Caenorhabditis nigoni]|uniref:Secreted protein n=1 Tax=Caenorhabditis nigoni TaxID=1611254 RepID=A0A2G5SXX5_9PELO|nr:hypothetical protein B9Z55_025220 [Caenorhabditis nigoni]
MRTFAVSATSFFTLCAAIEVDCLPTDIPAVSLVASRALRSWIIPPRIGQHCFIKRGEPSDFGPDFGDKFKIQTLSE